ncbi:MAG: alpha/beta fold hydrolase [Proteobacteria bacterium]|nr:alpha/beta fold hydrolase [Pseudomonadota bacterium]MDA0914569.1 alpha/beta fold hydrolase [Pseudomonadota bacterium]MDA1033552.1 alpha/beta fold hydrolase [Pseudomonadota bacterium]
MIASEYDQPRGPSPLLAWSEGRSVLEYLSFLFWRASLADLEPGRPHPVLVIPGFLASDRSTEPMRGLLQDMGYEAHGWGLGHNIRVDARRIEQLAEVLVRIFEEKGEPVSIIGWSLGGVFARELARAMPDKVRMVISLGSPINEDPRYSNVSPLFEAINGSVDDLRRDAIPGHNRTPPPVPSTSVYTKSDGVVHWRGSLQHEGPEAENVEVWASHTGLGFNPSVMVLIANRLRQDPEQWQDFEPSGWERALFPLP